MTVPGIYSAEMAARVRPSAAAATWPYDDHRTVEDTDRCTADDLDGWAERREHHEDHR